MDSGIMARLEVEDPLLACHDQTAGPHGTLRGPPAALGRVVRAFLATTVRTVRNGNERGCWG